VAGPRNARLVGRMLFASVFVVSGLVVAPMAAADPCPVFELGCVEDTGGVVEDTTTTAGGVSEDTTDTVGGVLEDATGTVGDVLQGDGPIETDPILDGVVPADGGVVSGGGGTSAPGGGGTTSGGGGSGGGGSTPGGGPQVGSSSSRSHGEPTALPNGSVGLISNPTGDAPTTAARPLPSMLDDASGKALLFGSQLARTLAFPLVLILLVIGFVLAQNRFDRKDPKLALAPVGSEYLTFS
jgi:uncharacterized membrane protein YphA (DoxX/SURF4 family)